MACEENLTELRSKNPAAARRIEAADPGKLRIGASRNGAPTLTLDLPDGRAVQAYSLYNPAAQAERDVARFAPGAGPIVVLGVGLGYHLEAVLHRFPDREVTAVEPDAAAARVALETHDWAAAFREGRLRLTVSADPAEAAAGLAADERNLFRHPVYVGSRMAFFTAVQRALRPPVPRRILSFMVRGDALPPALEDSHAALRALGCDVRVADLRTAVQHDDARERVLSALAEAAPDAVFTIDAAGLQPLWFAGLGIPVVSWYFDNPFAFLEMPGRDRNLVDVSPIRDCYHIFCWERAYVATLREQGFERVEFLPFAANPDVYAAGPPTDAERREYGCDVAFVGHSGLPDDDFFRRRVVTELRGYDVHVWGDAGWETVAGGGIRYRGRADNRTQAPAIYRAAAINLNVSVPQLITALPIRVFDVLCTGGFLLSDDRQDLEQLFRVGEEVAVFHSPGELKELTAHYLSRPDERARMAAAAAARVRAEHTYVHRLKHILKSVFGD